VEKQCDMMGRQHPWHGWKVQVPCGTVIGCVAGQFDTGTHAGRLRIHRMQMNAIAVYAVPRDAIATFDDGMIVLTDSAASVLREWLVYVIRRHVRT
jgi:hypothetical protein